MSLLVSDGASVGGFSPLSVSGVITNGVVERNDPPGSPLGLFVAFSVQPWLQGELESEPSASVAAPWPGSLHRVHRFVGPAHDDW